MLVGSWRAISATQAVFSLLLAVFAYFQFEESKAREKVEPLRVMVILRNYKEVFSHRTFVTMALIYALNFGAIFAFVSTSPLVLMERMHVTRAVYTVMFGSTLVGTVLGSTASSAFSRMKYSARKIVYGGLLLMTGCSVLALVLQLLKVRSPFAILVPAFVTFFCFGLTSPIVTLEALGPFPKLAGAGSGAIRALQMLMGSAASSGLAYVCALPRVSAGIATTLTMAVATGIGLMLFVPFRHAGLMHSNPDAGPPLDLDIGH